MSVLTRGALKGDPYCQTCTRQTPQGLAITKTGNLANLSERNSRELILRKKSFEVPTKFPTVERGYRGWIALSY
jgi:hypothetical protein